MRVPIGVRRPAATLEALGRSPLVKAQGADSPGVERVPQVAARARPAVFLAGRPAAERVSDARAGRIEALLLIGLAIQHNRPVMREGRTCPAIMAQVGCTGALADSALSSFDSQQPQSPGTTVPFTLSPRALMLWASSPR